MSKAENKIRLGIIGTGRIAHRFAKMAAETEMVTISCVYNPHLQSAEQFAEDCGIPSYTDNWDTFVNRVDAAYIASPHQTHENYAKKLLETGVHVLCEKPMSFRRKTAEMLYALAKEKDCILMEALKTADCPGFLAMMELAKSGLIGEIRDVEACFSRLTPTNLREYTDTECGGSFTEFGSYVLLPIFRLLGTGYQSFSSQSILAPNGVDNYTRLNFQYENAIAAAKTGLGVKTEGQLVISGTKGYILCESPWWLTRTFEVRYEDPNKREVYQYPYENSGLQYELETFIRRIQEKNAILEGGISQEESVAMAGVMEVFLEKSQKERRLKSHRKPVNIWAHRGCSMEYPENTLEAFEAAAKLPGLAGIELDVQFTKDHQIVVFHDENVSRVTNGTGNIRDYTLAELKKLEICSKDHQISRIPTLEEVLKLLKPYCEEKKILINIELKTSVVRYEGIEEATLNKVRDYGMEAYIVYSSFLPESVGLIKKLSPSAKTGMLAGTLEDAIKGARKVKADALHPGNYGLSCEIPKDMQHMPVRVWNGEEPFFKDGRILKERNMTKYAQFGATDIITNVPELYLGGKS